MSVVSSQRHGRERAAAVVAGLVAGAGGDRRGELLGGGGGAVPRRRVMSGVCMLVCVLEMGSYIDIEISIDFPLNLRYQYHRRPYRY